MHQRSFLIATLLFIAVIPLVFNIIKNPKNANAEVMLVCLLVPFIIYARAFHGLFILGILCYFLLIKKIPYKSIILSSIILSFLFILVFLSCFFFIPLYLWVHLMRAPDLLYESLLVYLSYSPPFFSISTILFFKCV